MFDLITIPSIHFNSRKKEKIKGIVVHCLGYTSLQRCIYSLLHYGVSAHYLVPSETMAEIQFQARKELALWKENPCIFNKNKDFESRPGWEAEWVSILSILAHASCYSPDHPPVIQMVRDLDRAWHAGISHWKRWSTTTSLNSCTIGIEFQCPGYAKNNNFYHFESYPECQKKTGISLLSTLIKKHHIPAHHIVAHSDIAWDRQPIPKTDPGPTFFWKELAHHGIGYLPPHTGNSPSFLSHEETISWVQTCFRRIGYRNCPLSGSVCDLTRRILNAYRMHFLTAESHLISPLGADCSTLITPLLLNTLSSHV